MSFLSASEDFTIRWWSINTGNILKIIKFTSRPIAVAFSPDRRTIGIGHANGTL